MASLNITRLHGIFQRNGKIRNNSHKNKNKVFLRIINEYRKLVNIQLVVQKIIAAVLSVLNFHQHYTFKFSCSRFENKSIAIT